MFDRLSRAALILLLVGIAAAWFPRGDVLVLRPESRLWFDGESTLRDWSCKAAVIDATVEAVEADGAAAIADVLKGQKAVRTVTLTFPTAKLDCDNGTMNGHMLKALNASKHPVITFVLTGYALDSSPNVTGTLEGSLALNGVTKAISLPVEFAAADGNLLRVTGSHALKMTDWQIEPPKLMLGTLKVKEMITVRFDLLLQP